MQWFRTNRIIGGRLALFALGLQIFLSFGHIHREDIYGYAPRASTRLAVNGAHAAPPQQQPSNHGDDYCAICATISLLSTSFVAASPLLPIPIILGTVEHRAALVASYSPLYRAQFRSRAPPAAVTPVGA